ncbi:MAG: hypothetical protein LIP16_20295 [Clostridium sp.]|nr:hypothetical protein [Clostridium sp.]
MPTVEEYKQAIIDNLDTVQKHLNEVLKGRQLDRIEPILTRIDASGCLPPWFKVLKKDHCLPNYDGKTIGSVIEKLLVCVLEHYIFNSGLTLSVNPARGVDIPELKLSVKSPSTNYDTSEPYFSAYERLLGNEYDSIVLLTDYQNAKKSQPLQLQILHTRYLRGSEIADACLCACAKNLRQLLGDGPDLKKAVCFLAYINQSDWEANRILKLINTIIIEKNSLNTELIKIQKEFAACNKAKMKKGGALIPQEALDRLLSIKTITPVNHAIITVAENWVISALKDNGRYPNENEWNRFLTSPLDGKIGMSFALQWRYNFRSLFN